MMTEPAGIPMDYDFSEERAGRLGARPVKEGFILDFFTRRICLGPGGVTALDGKEITPAIRHVLITYLNGCPDRLPGTAPTPVTFREFSGAAPLCSSFTANTVKTIERHFTGRPDVLANRAGDLGGIVHDQTHPDALGYDLSVVFPALPRIPVTLKFNDRDEIMPAAASLLYPDTAIAFLDLKSLMTIATYLTGCLIR